MVCFKEKAKPEAMTFSIWVGFRVERRREAGRHGRTINHTTESIRKRKKVFC